MTKISETGAPVKRISINAPQHIHEAAKMLAMLSGTNLNDYIVCLIAAEAQKNSSAIEKLREVQKSYNRALADEK